MERRGGGVGGDDDRLSIGSGIDLLWHVRLTCACSRANLGLRGDAEGLERLWGRCDVAVLKKQRKREKPPYGMQSMVLGPQRACDLEVVGCGKLIV